MYRKLTLLLSLSLFAACGKNSGPAPVDPGDKEEVVTSLYPWSDIAQKAQDKLESAYWRPAPPASNNYYYIDNIQDDKSFYHYWVTAHAMETLLDAYVRTGDTFYRERVAVVLARIKQKEGGVYTTGFYDDMAWMGIACIRAYRLLGEQVYLDAANALLADLKNGWVEPNGGMLWNKDPADKDIRNACTLWTSACFAARMYLLQNKQEDLDFAQKVYLWSMSNLYNAELGATFSDISRTNYSTYTQGVLIGSSLALYEATSQSSYLNYAIKCGDYCINNDSFGKDGIWRDEGAKDDLNKNNGVFKGILVHYMVDLVRCKNLPEAKRKAYIQYLESMAVTLYGATRQDYLFPGDWRRAAAAGERIYLGCQLSGVILLESMDTFFREYPRLLKNTEIK